ncbi:TPA: helix-turn-helix domain containing protein, partial [Enterococcus faecalis]
MKNWTTKEIQYLKKNALLAETNEVLNIAEMAKKLNRTTQSVRNKLYSMQRSGDMPAVDRSQQRDPHNRRYSPQDDKRIISMYKRGAMYREIGEALGRDERSISGRIHNLIRSGRLKAIKTKRWTDEEIQLL